MKIRKLLQIAARSLIHRLRRSPANRAKQQIVKDYARRAGVHILVETGTYVGDMVEATRRCFREIYSIELDDALYRLARWRFRKFKHINILHGDSTEWLPKILSSTAEPCLFWLDAHYSGGVTARGERATPVATELRTILSSRVSGHVILIDDADCFTGEGDYPSLEEVRRIAHGWCVASVDGIIRIVPPLRWPA